MRGAVSSLVRSLAAAARRPGPTAGAVLSASRARVRGAAPRAGGSGRPPRRAVRPGGWRSSGRRGSVRIKWLNATIAARRVAELVAERRRGRVAGRVAGRIGRRLSASGSCTRVSYAPRPGLPSGRRSLATPALEVRPELAVDRGGATPPRHRPRVRDARGRAGRRRARRGRAVRPVDLHAGWASSG